MLITLFFIITITFFLVFLIPGEMIPNAEKLSAEALASKNAFYGFDQPVFIQYFNYLKGIVLHFDFSVSMYDDLPVISKIQSTI